METSLRTGFAQIFSRCPKNLSCPKSGGGCSSPRPPGPYAYGSWCGFGISSNWDLKIVYRENSTSCKHYIKERLASEPSRKSSSPSRTKCYTQVAIQKHALWRKPKKLKYLLKGYLAAVKSLRLEIKENL